MNFINREILKEFDELLLKYKLSSVSHFEKRYVEQVMEKPPIQVHDQHIQINLIIPDYFNEAPKPKHGYWTGILSRDYSHAEGLPTNATEEERKEYHEWFNHITHCSVCGAMFDDRKINGWKGCPQCLSILDLEKPKEKES